MSKKETLKKRHLFRHMWNSELSPSYHTRLRSVNWAERIGQFSTEKVLKVEIEKN